MYIVKTDTWNIDISRYVIIFEQEEKGELLAKAGEDTEEKPDERQERLKAQMDKERIERKSKLNAYKVQKELEKAQKEEKKLREQLDEQKKKQEWKRRQVCMIILKKLLWYIVVLLCSDG